MTRRVFVDTEWTAPPWAESCELMWIGLADEAGKSWYGISAEAAIEPATNDFIAGAFRLITPDEPRLTRGEMAEQVVGFCGDVDEFWAWVPTQDRVAEWFGLGELEAADLHSRFWDTDLQMLRSVVRPWPARWPDRLCDLNAAAVAAGVAIPPRAENHLHPRVHAEWNLELFERIQTGPARA